MDIPQTIYAFLDKLTYIEHIKLNSETTQSQNNRTVTTIYKACAKTTGVSTQQPNIKIIELVPMTCHITTK